MLFVYSFQLRSAFCSTSVSQVSQRRTAAYLVYPILDIADKILRGFCTECTGQEMTLIPTVKMETRLPVEGSIISAELWWPEVARR